MSTLPVVLTQGHGSWLSEDEHPDAARGHRPDHLVWRPRPERAPLRGSLRDELLVAAPGSVAPGAVPSTDPADPFAFADTAYPWSAVGRVHVAGGWSSGALVGPRHLLTAAHVLAWTQADGKVAAQGGVRFVPAAFDARQPFGAASAVAVYAVAPTYAPAIDGTEERIDYAVCVLDREIGRRAGWMGVRAYRDTWDGLARWCLVGYRAEPGAGARPRYQDGIALDGCDDQEDCHQVMYHRGDVHPGQSGGPVFGWWEGEDFPRAVAVQSWGWPRRAGASGGDRLVDLVIRARLDHP